VQRWSCTGPAGSGVADGVNKNWLNAVGHPAGGRRASLQDIRRSSKGADRTARNAPTADARFEYFDSDSVSVRGSLLHVAPNKGQQFLFRVRLAEVVVHAQLRRIVAVLLRDA